MYKRRDWVYTHNPDTGEVSSDSGNASEDSECSEDEVVGDVGGDVAQECSESDSENDGDHARLRSMEQLQEMLDSDDEAEANPPPRSNKSSTKAIEVKNIKIEVEDQKLAWLLAKENTRGIPLRCLLCNKLIINSDVFQQHLKSKGHLAAAKRYGILNDQEKQLDNIVAASSIKQNAEETETHAQRLQRFQQVYESIKGAGKTKKAGENGERGSPAEPKRKLGGKRDHKKGKPGKRQRQALKAAAGADAKGGRPRKVVEASSE